MHPEGSASPAPASGPDYSTLETALGYSFTDKNLLRQALRHPSVLGDKLEPAEVASLGHNQRLEFLGDAILNAILATALYKVFPHEREGLLTRNRSLLARGSFLSGLAKRLELQEYLELSIGEKATGGKWRDSNLEDALEAVVGAIYLDSNWENTAQVVLAWYGSLNEPLKNLQSGLNPKGRLQELLQAEPYRQTIEYRLMDTVGPDHSKRFISAVFCNDEEKGRGEGATKKEAEENAAREALSQLKAPTANSLPENTNTEPTPTAPKSA